MSIFSKKSTLSWKSTFLAITILCLVLLTGFRMGNPAAGDKPFRGTYEGSIELPVGVPEQHITFTVAGTATHLGRFQMVNVADIDLTTLASEGTTAFTAANGDELYTTYSSSGTPNGDGTYTVTADHDITGGTGRFEGAEGSFTTTSLARVMATLETVTIAGRVYMTGTIRY